VMSFAGAPSRRDGGAPWWRVYRLRPLLLSTIALNGCCGALFQSLRPSCRHDAGAPLTGLARPFEASARRVHADAATARNGRRRRQATPSPERTGKARGQGR
jgi:hypothetical protein